MLNSWYDFNASGSSPEAKSEIKKYQSSQWDVIHSEAAQNEAFLNGDPRSYIEDTIVTGFTDNVKAIPPIDLNITEFMITNICTLYIGADRLTDHQGNLPPDYLDVDDFKEAMEECCDSWMLHGTAFLYIHKAANGDVGFSSVKPYNIIYDWNFSKVCVMTGTFDEHRYNFEYFEKTSSGNWRSATFVGWTFFTAGDNPFELDAQAKKDIQWVDQGVFPEIPVVPMFRINEKKAILSPISRMHKFLSVVLGFAMAGIPMSVFVKVYMKRNMTSEDESNDAFADMMSLLEMEVGEDAGVLDTGKGEAFLNFMKIMEALLSVMAQMLGVPKSATGGNLNSVRKSGAAMFHDNNAALNFRRRRVNKWNRIERRVFKVLKKLRPALSGFDFKPLDKDNDALLFDAESLQSYLIEGIKNGLIPYTSAIATKYGLAPDEAVKIAEKAKKDMEKYSEAFRAMGASPEKNIMAGGLKKGDLKDDNKQNDFEDESNENDD